MQSNNRLDGIIVPPLSKLKIHSITDAIREFLKIDTPYFPIVEIYEFLHVFGARFEVLFEHQMGGDHGRTNPDEKVIYIREDVYDGAHQNKPRDRFTLCHELGHLVLHRDIPIALSRIDPLNPPAIYRNSEWQADMFASCLMMPTNLLKTYSSLGDVTTDFGVSYSAASAREHELIKKPS